MSTSRFSISIPSWVSSGFNVCNNAYVGFSTAAEGTINFLTRTYSIGTLIDTSAGLAATSLGLSPWGAAIGGFVAVCCSAGYAYTDYLYKHQNQPKTTPPQKKNTASVPVSAKKTDEQLPASYEALPVAAATTSSAPSTAPLAQDVSINIKEEKDGKKELKEKLLPTNSSSEMSKTGDLSFCQRAAVFFTFLANEGEKADTLSLFIDLIARDNFSLIIAGNVLIHIIGGLAAVSPTRKSLNVVRRHNRGEDDEAPETTAETENKEDCWIKFGRVTSGVCDSLNNVIWAGMLVDTFFQLPHKILGLSYPGFGTGLAVGIPTGLSSAILHARMELNSLYHDTDPPQAPLRCLDRLLLALGAASDVADNAAACVLIATMITLAAMDETNSDSLDESSVFSHQNALITQCGATLFSSIVAVPEGLSEITGVKIYNHRMGYY